MHLNPLAEPRHEISTFLEEAQGQEKHFIAEKIMPVYPSDKRSGEYPRIRIKKGNLLKRRSTVRAPRSAYQEVSRTTELDNFKCVERGLEELVDEVEAATMKQYFDMEVIAAQRIREELMRDYEVRVAETVTDPNVFNSTNATVEYTEANIATIDFAKDIQDAIYRMAKRGVTPNTLIIPRAVLDRLRRSTKFQTFLFGNLPNGEHRVVKPGDIGKVFDIFENVYVPHHHYDDAEVGQAIDLKPCWSDDYISLLDVQSGDYSAGGVGRTITWSADSPGGLYTSESYPDKKHRGERVRVRMFTDEKIVNDLAGELIATGFNN